MRRVVFKRRHLPCAAGHVGERPAALVLSAVQKADSDVVESAAGQLAVAAREMRRVRSPHRVPLFRGGVSNGVVVRGDVAAVSATSGGFPVGDDGAGGGDHLH